MGYGYDLSAIGKAFIAIAFLVGMVECVTLFTQALCELFPWFPDEYHWTAAYGFSCALGAWICWQGHFDIFVLLGFNWWQHHWLGYVGTGCIIGGGVKRLLLYLKTMRAFPSIVGGNSYSSYGGLDTDFESTPSTSATPETTAPTLEENQKGEE